MVRLFWLSMMFVLSVLRPSLASAAEVPQDSVWEASEQERPLAIPEKQAPAEPEGMKIQADPRRLGVARGLLAGGAALTYGGMGMLVVAYLGTLYTYEESPWGELALVGLVAALPGPALMLAGARTARMMEPRRWNKKERIGAVLYGLGAGLLPLGLLMFAGGIFGLFAGASDGTAALLLLGGAAATLAGTGLYITGAIFSHIAARREIRGTARKLAVVPFHRRDGQTTGLAMIGPF